MSKKVGLLQDGIGGIICRIVRKRVQGGGPSTVKRDERIKFALYQGKGMKTYILVYPRDRKIVIYQLTGGRYRKVGDDKMESFDFRVKDCAFRLDFE